MIVYKRFKGLTAMLGSYLHKKKDYGIAVFFIQWISKNKAYSIG